MARMRAQASVPRLQRREELPRLGDGVDAQIRPRAMRGAAADDDLAPGEALMGDRQFEMARLGNDRGVGAEARDDFFRAERSMLLVGDAGDDDVAFEPRFFGA